jgi:hypothetical protein
MADPRLGGATLDRLDLGSEGPAGGRRSWWRAAALVAIGSIIGWSAAHGTGADRDAAAGPSDAPVLVAGAVQQDLANPFASDFLVTLSNPGKHRVEVLGVAPGGWAARTAPVEILPGGSVDVPVDVSLDCLSTPPPSDVVDVRVAVGHASRMLELPLAQVPPALQEEYARRCRVQSLRVPSHKSLLGTWVVEDGGPAFTGKMLIRFTGDGGYAMDSGTHLDDDPGAAGRYTLGPRGRVILRTLVGGDCGRRRRAVWLVGLQADGRLHIQQRTSYDGYCTVERGDVWIAKRVLS